MSDQKIDSTKLTEWKVENINEYEGVYFFGISEGESQFNLAIEKDTICAQIEYFEWVEKIDGKGGPEPRFELFKNVRIVGNKFFSNIANGEFVIYNDGNEKIKGIKIYNPWSGEEGFEIGEYEKKNYLEYFDGKYPFTKFKVITKTELEKYNPKELDIIVNEIFARYCYIFKPNGEMEKYFKQQNWYTPINKDVYSLLNTIEKRNIQIISEIRKK